MCSKLVTTDQEGIQCASRSLWFHKNSQCCEFQPEVQNILLNAPCVCFCPHCDEPSQSHLFLNVTLDSLRSDNFLTPFSETIAFRKRITNSDDAGVFQAIKKDIILTHRADFNTIVKLSGPNVISWKEI